MLVGQVMNWDNYASRPTYELITMHIYQVTNVKEPLVNIKDYEWLAIALL